MRSAVTGVVVVYGLVVVGGTAESSPLLAS